MIPTYDSYLNEKQPLTFAEMQQIHADLVSEIGTDADALDLYNELLRASVKYAGIRAKWPSLSKQEKIDQDASRSACHDSVIIKINKLSRYLKTIGKEATWRESLGDESADPYIRKRIGDFACYLAFVNCLYAR